MSWLRRFLDRLAESDEDRLAAEIRSWAATVPGSIPIPDAPLRSSVVLAGVVKRITVLPVEGQESLQALLSDGGGEVAVVWTGRRLIPGLDLGTRLIVQGVVAEHRGGRRMVNPRFEFST